MFCISLQRNNRQLKHYTTDRGGERETHEADRTIQKNLLWPGLPAMLCHPCVSHSVGVATVSRARSEGRRPGRATSLSMSAASCGIRAGRGSREKACMIQSPWQKLGMLGYESSTGSHFSSEPPGLQAQKSPPVLPRFSVSLWLSCSLTCREYNLHSGWASTRLHLRLKLRPTTPTHAEGVGSAAHEPAQLLYPFISNNTQPTHTPSAYLEPIRYVNTCFKPVNHLYQRQSCS